MSDSHPARPFGGITDQVTSIIDEMFGKHYARFCPANAWRPDVSLYETDDRYLVCVDLAGMKQGDFDVQSEGGVLMIRGARPRPLPPGGGTDLRVHLMEIDAGDFCREVEIPSEVRHGEISAEYRDGLLWITLPKR